MQRTGAGPLTRQVLVVDGGLAEATSTAARSVRALVTELRARNIDVLEAMSYEDGLATVVSDAGIHCILVDWTRSSDDSAAREQATELLRAVRARNAKVPIFLMASRKLAGSVSVETATLADEYIWILADTAPFIAGRVQAAIERYLEALLPPYAAALARYEREREYSWAAPGHQGGVAFLKSPVGRVFFDFYGENLFRTDMGIERGALGSLLGHSGPVGESERNIARIFGADRSYSVTERHVRLESRNHVRVRRGRGDRALRSQLSQVHRTGSGDHRRYPGLSEPDPQSLRHHRPDSAAAARAQGDREMHRRQSAGEGRRPQARRVLGADQLHVRRDVLRRRRRRDAAREERRPRSFRRGVVRLRALQPHVSGSLRDARQPGHPPEGWPDGFRDPFDAQAAGRAVADLVHPHP